MDTGRPTASEAEDIAQEFLPSSAFNADDAQLKLMGAVARLKSVTGEADEALKLQCELAELWAATPDPDQAGYPLAEWLRLAGAMENWQSFDRAVELKDKVTKHLWNNDTLAYLSLAWSRALALFGPQSHQDLPKARATLYALATNLDIPIYLRWSAARGLLARSDGSKQFKKIKTELTDAARNEKAAQWNLRLVSLDSSIKREEGEQAKKDVENLRALQPGLITHLLNSVPKGKSREEWVREYFPY
jgi:hypothetical protein